MSQPRPGKASTQLDSVEESQCRTPAEWVRLYVSKNPDEHALQVFAAYGSSRGAQLGPLSLDDVQNLQAELGAAGLSPEKLAEQRARASKRRREHLEKVARFRQMQPEEMAALPDRDLCSAVMLQLGEDDETRTGRAHASASGRRVFAAVMLDADVKNGGFSQYFHNSNIKDGDEAVAGLEMIGVEGFAEVARRAIDLFRVKSRSTGYSLEVRDPDFAVFDAEYYALLRAGRAQGERRSDAVGERLAAFLRAHLSELWRA